MVAIVVGVATLFLRKYIFVGGQAVDRYRQENNLANTNRKPTAPEDQRIIIGVGLVLIGAGLLYILKILPRE